MELADTKDLGSFATACGFKSRVAHHKTKENDVFFWLLFRYADFFEGVAEQNLFCSAALRALSNPASRTIITASPTLLASVYVRLRPFMSIGPVCETYSEIYCDLFRNVSQKFFAIFTDSFVFLLKLLYLIPVD